MYDVLLVPVDLDHPEPAAAMFAAAKALLNPEGRLIATYIAPDVPLYVEPHIPTVLLDENIAAARRVLTDLIAQHAPEAEIHVRSGPAAAMIIAAAEEHKADAIVLASHKPGLTDYLLGSTAARVVRHAPCSVLVMR